MKSHMYEAHFVDNKTNSILVHDATTFLSKCHVIKGTASLLRCSSIMYKYSCTRNSFNPICMNTE